MVAHSPAPGAMGNALERVAGVTVGVLTIFALYLASRVRTLLRREVSRGGVHVRVTWLNVRLMLRWRGPFCSLPYERVLFGDVVKHRESTILFSVLLIFGW